MRTAAQLRREADEAALRQALPSRLGGLPLADLDSLTLREAASVLHARRSATGARTGELSALLGLGPAGWVVVSALPLSDAGDAAATFGTAAVVVLAAALAGRGVGLAVARLDYTRVAWRVARSCG